jgi:predicted RNA polymerase sigma factor
MAYGPARGLEIADTLTSEPVGYAQLPAVRGDLLAKLGRRDEARVEFTRAAALTGNERETGHLPGASLSLPRRTGVIMTSRNGAAPSAPAHQRGRRLHLI